MAGRAGGARHVVSGGLLLSPVLWRNRLVAVSRVVTVLRWRVSHGLLLPVTSHGLHVLHRSSRVGHLRRARLLGSALGVTVSRVRLEGLVRGTGRRALGRHALVVAWSLGLEGSSTRMVTRARVWPKVGGWVTGLCGGARGRSSSSGRLLIGALRGLRSGEAGGLVALGGGGAGTLEELLEVHGSRWCWSSGTGGVGCWAVLGLCKADGGLLGRVRVVGAHGAKDSGSLAVQVLTRAGLRGRGRREHGVLVVHRAKVDSLSCWWKMCNKCQQTCFGQRGYGSRSDMLRSLKPRPRGRAEVRRGEWAYEPGRAPLLGAALGKLTAD